VLVVNENSDRYYDVTPTGIFYVEKVQMFVIFSMFILRS